LCFNDAPLKKSLSLALGVFIGIIPIWGFQSLAVISLAVLFKLNKSLAFLASNISIPPMIPFIVLMATKIGSLVLGHSFQFSNFTQLNQLPANLLDYILGSFILATSVACLVGCISFVIFQQFVKKNNE
jgi:uncharacterized protein (DUF2062 family)